MDQNRRSRTKNSCSGENAGAKNRSNAQEDGRRNSTEGFQPWSFIGFPCLASLNNGFSWNSAPLGGAPEAIEAVAGGGQKKARQKQARMAQRGQGIQCGRLL